MSWARVYRQLVKATLGQGLPLPTTDSTVPSDQVLVLSCSADLCIAPFFTWSDCPCMSAHWLIPFYVLRVLTDRYLVDGCAFFTDGLTVRGVTLTFSLFVPTRESLVALLV